MKKKSYKIINDPDTLKLTSDKYLSPMFAIKNQIPYSETIKAKKTDIKKIESKINKWKNVVVKPITSQGQGVFLF